MRKLIVIIIAVTVLLVGCTAGDDTAANDTTGASPGTTGTTPVPSGPAPGLTDDTVRIGVTYVDLEAISDVVDISHGDYESAYQALFDEINAGGGINGRTLEPVFAPVNPIGTEAAEAACVELTEDDPVFVILGFFLDDAVLCPVETHQTAVIGGSMTPQRIERAQAPWYSNESSTDFQSEVIRTMADEGELDGSLGVFAAAGQEAQMNDLVLPLLDELDVEVVESAVVDAPPDDTDATDAATAVIAERFESSGVDQVLTVGTSGQIWASGIEPLDYRPEIRLTDPNSILAYAGDQAGRDLSVLDGAVGGNLYGGPANLFADPGMQECIGVLEDHGVDVPDPATTEQGNFPFQAPFTACKQIGILQAFLEAAGEDLNYGSFAAAVDGLEVTVPGEPEPRTFGPGAAADGDPIAYLFDWDPDARDFILREG